MTAPDTSATGRDAELAALLTHAESLGLDPRDVDELVYDASSQGASDAYNGGAQPDLSDGAAYEELHGTADHEASEINNGGLPAQVRFLHEQFGATAARGLLDRAASA